MIISNKMTEELRYNNKLKALISIAHRRTVYTIDRWIRKKDIKHLTTAVILHMDIIKQETGFSADEILVPDNQHTSD
jgi:hypothetical protein